MKTYDAAVIGEIYVDHIFSGFQSWPSPGEEVFTRHYTHEIGGGAANTACALARLGRSVNLIGVVGSDQAAWLANRLDDFGVSSDFLRITGEKTGVTMSVSTREDRSFFTFVGANAGLEDQLRDPVVIALLAEARHVHFALPLSADLALSLLPQLRDAGCTTSLDVGFQIDWLRSPARIEICRAAGFLLPNEREAALFTGSPDLDFLSFLAENGISRGVLKLGSRGAAMLEGGQRFHEAPPPVEVVDTTGAGDAFDAGFIDGLLDAAAPEVCLRRACICGGLSTRVAGALSALPSREEVQHLYEQTYPS